MNIMQENSTKQVLIAISTRNPTGCLIHNIANLQSMQLSDGNAYKIICVDSDSDNFETYETINNRFPFVEIHMVKNKNYEYGAYKYAVTTYPNYDIYICIQDTFLITSRVDLSEVNDYCCYSSMHDSGFFSHPEVKEFGKQLLSNTVFESSSLIDTYFTLAMHSSFIVTNKVLNDIFNTLINPPCDKYGSCCYERLFGLYFILKGIKTININPFAAKLHGGRM
jgi:hypothetical protein